MHESVFNGNESYLPSGSSTITPYADPNAFDNRDFTLCYVQRNFNTFDGWTGCGVNTASSLTKASLVSAGNWQIVANTSVWDTNTTAGTIDYAGSLANALRIYSYARLKISPTKDLTCSGATEINGPSGLRPPLYLGQDIGPALQDGGMRSQFACGQDGVRRARVCREIFQLGCQVADQGRIDIRCDAVASFFYRHAGGRRYRRRNPALSSRARRGWRTRR